MIIGMTVEAGCSQAQVRACNRFPGFFYLDVFAFMTGSATQGIVLSGQLKARIPVIEFQRIEPDDFKVSSVVLIMTGKTFPAFDLGRGMISSV
jgi:hypothetical protein